MKLLLDTHAFVRAIAQPRLLSKRAAALVEESVNVILVSAVSAYEIEFKRLRDPVLAALPADLDEAVGLAGYEWLPLTPAHATTAGRLPRLNGDPFDRMLAAQGLVEQVSVVTRDPSISAYGAVVAW
jgi:PIN domain nuclease of toxin-antitoxin system